MSEWLAEKNLPGISVAVGVDGELVWAEGFGWADLEQHRSVSKGLTSAAVGLLHERGVLKLDAPVRGTQGFRAADLSPGPLVFRVVPICIYCQRADPPCGFNREARQGLFERR